MKIQLDEETKKRLIMMHKQVKEDFKEFPYIKTTEDFFIWREQIKLQVEKRIKGTKEQNNNEYKKYLRNKIIENEIKGNSSLELLNDWSKCYRMIDRAKASLYMAKAHYGILDSDNRKIKATIILHQHLVKQGKANVDELFGILQSNENDLNLWVNYPLKQRTINTPYEFEKVIVKEEEYTPWPAILFVTLLKAYGVDGKDLLTVGKTAENLSKSYIREIEYEHKKAFKKYIYNK